ncbi:MAG: response regulator [Desulfuromonadales bacterium]|nr:response regulator [Desulfuromonadales bacterium]
MFDNITILAADDDSMNLEMLEIMLSELGARLLKAENGQQTLDVLKTEPNIDVVLLDLEMPVMDGFETIKQIKQSFRWRDIPVIVVTAGASEVTRTLALGANDFIAKPYNPDELRLRVMNHVRTKRLSDLAKEMNDVLEGEVVKKTAALKKALDMSKEAEFEISMRLGRAAEFRDQETGMHIRRISELSKHLALLYGISEEQCEVLRFASPMHDVGKIGIPDRILCNPGKLNQSEFDIIKLHTEIGAKILSDAERYPVIKAGHIIALQHHEKWDGSGYPSGLKGEEIHIFARIVSIVDVFDALTSKRPYKDAFPFDKAMSIMEEGRGVFFDPELLDLFLNNVESFIAIREKLKDTPDQQSHIWKMEH